MQASKQSKKLISKLRSKYGKKNGVIPGWVMDIPFLDCEPVEKPKYKAKEEKHGDQVDVC